MTEFKIAVTGDIAAWIEERVRSEAYDDAADYVRELIRRDQERAAVHHEVQQLITEGVESGMSNRTPEQLLEAARAAAEAARGKVGL